MSEVFAALADYVRDYRDCADHCSEISKLEVYRELEEYMSQLSALGVSLRHATRDIDMRLGGPDREVLSVRVLYLVWFPNGQEPDSFATPKAWKFGF